ncbi:prepilin-type N-terminal cleavage/methylation domain-containing protein [uncultured Microbacterium sp.]|uniref:prepilin-type N-terminal cleavage/methylation domain-containing protein n=1 Tax=uncultured Microbacterium sp. TaxID=191216 RepID=UPI00260FA324|nr:prepilin-type N-terminal cleavage/methylation domain-containing protein [uncultured Microbacterium sp.]
MRTQLSAHDDERGVTLIELIIYMLLAAVFLVIVSAIFINGWLSQAATADRDAATGNANLVTASLQQSIRNASAVHQPAGMGNAVTAVVAIGDAADSQCRAWVWTLDTAASSEDADRDHYQLRYATSGAAIDMTRTDGVGWATLASAVVPKGDPAPSFTVTSTTGLTYSFAAESNDRSKDSQPVQVDGSVTAQAVIPGGRSCW